MNPTEKTCDTERIERYLDERLEAAQLTDFEAHLSTCDFCQIELQRRAADPELWRDAVELLSDSATDLKANSTDTPESDARQRSAASVLDSLAPTDDPEMLGRIDDYEISGVVGVGGMGAVLKGFDRSLRRVVAIKVMAPHLADSGSARARFHREARAAAAITHDNVIDTYGVSETNGLPYLVMPFARGPSLQKRIDESGPLTAVEVVRIGRQIASGLAAAHEQGLVHRDIKPANILLNEGIERLWITDFGVARAMDDASMTQTGVIAGTPQYMSPEQARGETVDQRSDLFSMGSVLYTACTGRPPFRSEAAYGILRRITDTDPRPIRELNPEIPEWLSRLIMRLMAKEACLRFEDAAEVADLFESCLAYLQQPTLVELPESLRTASDVTGHRQPESNPAAPLPEPKPQLSRPRRTRLWLIAGAVCAAFGLFAWQQTGPADIAGTWTGDKWNAVALSTVTNADGWYSGSFTDEQGRQGALQLEWSRLQRQYNGRWKIGSEQSGAVTVRRRGHELQGAIMVDADSPVSPRTPRLRAFSWRPSAGGQPARKQPENPTHTGGQRRPVYSPIAGIARWAEGITENDRIEEGALIAEISALDPVQFNRLREEAGTLERTVERTEARIKTIEADLQARHAVVDSFRSQLEILESSKRRVSAENDLRIRKAEADLAVARTNLTTVEDALRKSKAEIDRLSKQVGDETGSTREQNEAAKKHKSIETRVDRLSNTAEALDEDLAARKRDAESKVALAQLDIDKTMVEFSKATSEVAKVEGDLTAAMLELTQTRKQVADINAELEREHTVQVRAPHTAFVVELSRRTNVREGDILCVLVTPPGSADADPSRPAHRPVERRADRPAGPPRISGALLELTDTIESAIALGRRFRLNRQNANASSRLSSQQLLSDQAGADNDRETAIAILKSQLAAARKLHESQVTLTEQMRKRVDITPISLLEPEVALVESERTVRQLEVLLAYYEQLDQGKAEPAADVALAEQVLNVQLEAARKRDELVTRQSDIARQQFEVGAAEIQEVTKTRQAAAEASAEVQTVEALLAYYKRAATRHLSSEVAPMGTDGLPRPATAQERETMLKLLSAQLVSAQTHLSVARSDLERTESLIKEGAASKSSSGALKAKVAEHEATVKSLEIRIEHYRSLQLEE